MLALDTNVLVRYFARDVPSQAVIAKSFLYNLNPEGPGFIGREVVLETVWVLERAYKFSRVRIANALFDLLDTDGIIIENGEDVAESARRYRDSNADFSDLLILAAAQRVGATPLYTFDQKLARMEGATLLETTLPDAA